MLGQLQSKMASLCVIQTLLGRSQGHVRDLTPYSQGTCTCLSSVLTFFFFFFCLDFILHLYSFLYGCFTVMI